MTLVTSEGIVMFTKKLFFVGFLFFLSIPHSYALKCQQTSSGLINDTTTITDTTAIPNSLPAGTVLWRQPTQRINVQCWVDIQGSPGENIYFYMNPNRVDLGKDIEIGVTYEGKDYLYSSLTGGKLNIGWWVNGCPANDNCGWQKESKAMTYSLFFVKKSPAGDNKEGPITSLSDYRAFQFDGVGGVRPGVSYNVTVKGLNKFRYLPCESSINIQPSVIDFGAIRTSGAKVGATIKDVPFTITEQRTCNAAYGLGGYLEPLTGTLSSSQDTLIPTDNKSVGISLINEDDQRALLFKKEFVLTPKTTSTTNSHNFLARLKWMTATPSFGEFNAGATLDIFYK